MVMSPSHQVWPNHLARHGDRRKKTRQTEEEVGRQRKRWEDRGRGGKTEEEVGRLHQDGPALRQVPDNSEKQRKMEETGCEVLCGAPTTLAVKE